MTLALSSFGALPSCSLALLLARGADSLPTRSALLHSSTMRSRGPKEKQPFKLDIEVTRPETSTRSLGGIT
jgi:hypothetical protein